DGIRDYKVTGVQTCALPILLSRRAAKMIENSLPDLLFTLIVIPEKATVVRSSLFRCGVLRLRAIGAKCNLAPIRKRKFLHPCKGPGSILRAISEHRDGVTDYEVISCEASAMHE